MPLRDRTVVVSGVGPGLGHRVAAAVIRDGGRAVLGARTGDRLAATAAAVDPAGDRTAWRPTDITDEAQCAALAALAVERFGGIDAVVHVAALDRHFGGLDDADFAVWARVVDVNLLGTLRMTRACLPALRVRGGSVVLIGTQSAVAAPTRVRQTAYAASKGALTSAMYALARELGPDRIRVNTVLPGWMWGPPVEAYVRGTARAEGVPEPEVRARLTERMALPEPATDGDVAEAVVFLASDRARSITGQSLLVNAGELMR
ncbi:MULTISPECIES: SDR family oxidoreductase [Streptomyces]|uniref:KR domain-containing protein n=1 Tax=Streptomyces tsukubensis (strain DSM 42081 / NBRC 108919 / NRRL 18488 / 9993) TaxID=1114943 RepID=I2N029_STRT9|nr:MULTISPECIES: SDR family oxidoreductase [Streptomyces]AZK94602.1 short-chain dehydrogenase [Streptomyces tsukubensis]EIF90376.1 short chain dehydrogenase [Streptomyces tsukubensis NRRL18488]MYS65580.1 SDR family oxidoreductase [Streptomyces sp. SID5473]QKM69312.1 KR domain-containing protein [Streptomyces tsukubensis NRRL18488]TAI42756.1 SDR family oxidoreductase [Streptomyces tsukubensis]